MEYDIALPDCALTANRVVPVSGARPRPREISAVNFDLVLLNYAMNTDIMRYLLWYYI